MSDHESAPAAAGSTGRATQEAAHYTLRLADGQTFGPATIDLLAQWAREGRVPRDAVLDPVERSAGAQTASVLAVPELSRILNAPPTQYAGPPTAGAGAGAAKMPGSEKDAVSALIPYKNKPALIGYYLGVASLIPIMGMVTGIAAIVLGIWGLVARLNDPEIRGMAHAIVAIILGIGGPLLWVRLVLMMR